MRFPFFRNRDSVKNGILISIRRTGDGFHPGLFTIPSLPVMIQLIKVCGLPVERYFNPEIMREESDQRQRVSHKLKLCPEEYLPIIEGAIDGALKMEQTAKQKEDA